MARKRNPPVETDDARLLGALLRDLRKASGYRAVKDVQQSPDCPAAQQTIYAYERGGLVPSLPQFLELVEFYCLRSPRAAQSVRYMGVAAIQRALWTSAYHVRDAFELSQRLSPDPTPGRRRRSPKEMP